MEYEYTRVGYKLAEIRNVSNPDYVNGRGEAEGGFCETKFNQYCCRIVKLV